MESPAQQPNNQDAAAPEPEVLQPRSEDSSAPTASTSGQPLMAPKSNKRPHRAYRPNHKATFVGSAVVIAILAANAAVLGIVLKGRTQEENLANKGQVTISSSVLSQLGVNRSSIGDAGVTLTVSPDSRFQGTVSVAGTTTISGQLTLNNKLVGTNGSFTQLQAGSTALSQLSVNGNTTLSDLNLRKDLVVAGLAQLQSIATKGDASIGGNLVVSGALSVSTFSARSLTSTSTLTIGGHIITNGGTPGLGRGSALGSNGTVSISGNDSAGTIAINVGAGASGGLLTSLAFHTEYTATPEVVITPVGIGGEFYIINLTTSGFSIAVMNGLSPGGYRINYIVEQ